MEKTALDRYEEIVTDALSYCTAKLRKSFKSAFILVMILYMARLFHLKEAFIAGPYGKNP